MANEVMSDWETMMRVICPSAYGKRPRRLSIHTIAAVCGRDAHTILKEMKESNKVVGYKCPDVGGAVIFYLKDLAKLPGMIDTRTDACWEQAEAALKKWDPKKVKGFKRFAYDDYTMSVPFDKEDAEYEKMVYAALELRRAKLTAKA